MFLLQTIDALMELMQRCMFHAPLAKFQQSLKSYESSSTPAKQVTLPFRADASHQSNCTVVSEGQGAVAQGSGSASYMQGVLALTSGKYTWKVCAVCMYSVRVVILASSDGIFFTLLCVPELYFLCLS